MKIIYDYQVFDIQAYGGISRYCYELAANISFMPGVEVEVFAPLYQNSYLIDAPASMHVSGYLMPSFRGARRLARAVNRSLGNLLIPQRTANIYHETYFQAKAPTPRGAKTVLTVYDMVHELFPDEVPEDGTRAAKRAAVARADHIICISENTKRDLIRILGIEERKVSVVLLGIGELTPSTSEIPLNRVLGASPYVLYVGQRDGYKNFDRLLEVFAETAALRNGFRIVCFGGGSFSEVERKKLRAAGLDQHAAIQLGGGDELLWRAYANAAVFVYPSLYEGFGIPPLEAMRAGCPVVSSQSSSLPEVVGDAALLFDPLDASDLAKKMQSAVNDLALRQALVEKGLRRVRSFSWKKTAVETLEIYRQLVDSEKEA